MKFFDNLSRQGNYEPLDNWHEDFIVHLARLLKPQVYVELGIYRASLFNKMAKVAEECYGVDCNPAFESFIKPAPNVYFCCTTTSEFSYELKNIPLIDMLFIDADHSLLGVLTDFHNYCGMVSDNGIIFIHDTYPKSEQFTGWEYCGDGYKAIDRIKKIPGFEMMTIPLHPGLTIVRKTKRQVDWD